MNAIFAAILLFISAVSASASTWIVYYPSSVPSYKAGDLITVVAYLNDGTSSADPTISVTQNSVVLQSGIATVNVNSAGVYVATFTLSSSLTAGTAIITVSGGTTGNSPNILNNISGLASINISAVPTPSPTYPCYPYYGCNNYSLPCYSKPSCNIPQPRRKCRIYSEGLDSEQAVVVVSELPFLLAEGQQLQQEVLSF